MELVRKILLYIEDNCDHDLLPSHQISFGGYSTDEVAYNIRVMVDGGLLDVVETSTLGDRFGSYLMKGITWYGHEFLDSVSNEGVRGNGQSRVSTSWKPASERNSALQTASHELSLKVSGVHVFYSAVLI